MTREISPSGFWQTAVRVTFGPTRFFQAPPGSRSRWTPRTFAIGVMAIALPVGRLFDVLLWEGGGAAPAIFSALGYLVLSPIFAIVSLYVSAGLTHLLLRAVRGANARFSETLACVGYCMAPALIGVVPVLGGVVGNIWQLILLVLGLRVVQRTSSVRAAVAVVGPPVFLVAFALFLRADVLEAFKIPSGAMLPTLEINDYVFANKLVYGPKVPLSRARIYSRLPPRYGDVMVFEYPDPNPENERQDFIKRVIALPGDELVVEEGHPIVNGWRVPSCRVGRYEVQVDDGKIPGDLFVEYLGSTAYLTFYEAERYDGRQGPYRVAPGEVWVMGDNRNNSSDSRAWAGGRGAGVPFENIKGRASIIWMAFGTDGTITWPRLFHSVMGPPLLPSSAPPEVREALQHCLARVHPRTPPRRLPRHPEALRRLGDARRRRRLSTVRSSGHGVSFGSLEV